MKIALNQKKLKYDKTIPNRPATVRFEFFQDINYLLCISRSESSSRSRAADWLTKWLKVCSFVRSSVKIVRPHTLCLFVRSSVKMVKGGKSRVTSQEQLVKSCKLIVKSQEWTGTSFLPRVTSKELQLKSGKSV